MKKQSKNKTARKKAVKQRSLLELQQASFGPLSVKGLKVGRSVGMAGLAAPAMNPQTVMPRVMSRRRSDGNVVEVLVGTDLVATVTSGSSNAPGDLLVTQLISPARFPDTRQLQFSNLYQRYRYTKVEFLYEPIANATQSGQLLGFCDFDVADVLPSTDATNLQVGAAHQGQQITQIWEPCSFAMRQVPTFTDLFVEDDGIDPRLSQQGVFYLMAASSLPDNVPLGNVYVSYEIEFSIPNLTPASVLPGAGQWAYGPVASFVSYSGSDAYFSPTSTSSMSLNGLNVEPVSGAYYVTGLTIGGNYHVQLSGSIAATTLPVSGNTILHASCFYNTGSSNVSSGSATAAVNTTSGWATFELSWSFSASAGSYTFVVGTSDSGDLWGLDFLGATFNTNVSIFSIPVTYAVAKARRRRRFGVLSEIDQLRAQLEGLQNEQRAQIKSQEATDEDSPLRKSRPSASHLARCDSFPPRARIQ